MSHERTNGGRTEPGQEAERRRIWGQCVHTSVKLRHRGDLGVEYQFVALVCDTPPS